MMVEMTCSMPYLNLYLVHISIFSIMSIRLTSWLVSKSHTNMAGLDPHAKHRPDTSVFVFGKRLACFFK